MYYALRMYTTSTIMSCSTNNVGIDSHVLYSKLTDTAPKHPRHYLAGTVSFISLERGWHICKTAEVLGKLCVDNTCSTPCLEWTVAELLTYSQSTTKSGAQPNAGLAATCKHS